jgi:Fe-S-cluster containining protein
MTREVSFDHRDPALRPFIEVEAKLARGALREEGLSPPEIVAALVDAGTSDAERGAREMSEQIPATKRLLPVCQEGCAHCCYTSVLASTPEILRIADHLRSARSEAELAALRRRATETAAKVRDLDLEGRAKAHVPCPLLDVAHGKCTVYDVRPVPCRAYHSGDVSVCKKAFDAGEANPIVPINPVLFHVAHAYGFGMMTGCASDGLDVGPYDLAAVLPAALEGEDLARRWLAKEKVFAHTPLSDEARSDYEAVLRELVGDLNAGRLMDAERLALRMDPDARRRERNKKKREKKKR